MTTVLSDELQKELERQGDRPLRIVHPGSKKEYVVLSAELFDRLRPMFEEVFDIRETYEAQEAALAKVWNEPELDIYADYDRHRKDP